MPLPHGRQDGQETLAAQSQSCARRVAGWGLEPPRGARTRAPPRPEALCQRLDQAPYQSFLTRLASHSRRWIRRFAVEHVAGLEDKRRAPKSTAHKAWLPLMI